MATIKYTFADGHSEEVEVTEEFKREYEFLLIFPLSPNDMNDLCALYEKAGQINEIEVDNIVHNERGCAFLISSPESRTNIRIVATPYFEKIFG